MALLSFFTKIQIFAFLQFEQEALGGHDFCKFLNSLKSTTSQTKICASPGFPLKIRFTLWFY